MTKVLISVKERNGNWGNIYHTHQQCPGTTLLLKRCTGANTPLKQLDHSWRECHICRSLRSGEDLTNADPFTTVYSYPHTSRGKSRVSYHAIEDCWELVKHLGPGQSRNKKRLGSVSLSNRWVPCKVCIKQ